MDYSDVKFPSSVGTVLTYLKPLLEVPVYNTVPRDVGNGYVRVSRAGGGMRNAVTDSPTIAIMCYHSDAYEAEQLANRVRALMLGIRGKRVGEAFVRWWDDAGMAEFTDPDTRLIRYQVTGELRLKIN